MTYRPFAFYRICPEDAHTCTKPTCLAQVACAGFAKPPLCGDCGEDLRSHPGLAQSKCPIPTPKPIQGDDHPDDWGYPEGEYCPW